MKEKGYWDGLSTAGALVIDVGSPAPWRFLLPDPLFSRDDWPGVNVNRRSFESALLPASQPPSGLEDPILTKKKKDNIM